MRFFGLVGPIQSPETISAVPVYLSSLLAAGRHQELLEMLALRPFPFWPDRKFSMRALLADGRIEEALAYAKASHGLNGPDAVIDPACEKVLLDLCRMDEAYEAYAGVRTPHQRASRRSGRWLRNIVKE